MISCILSQGLGPEAALADKRPAEGLAQSWHSARKSGLPGPRCSGGGGSPGGGAAMRLRSWRVPTAPGPLPRGHLWTGRRLGCRDSIGWQMSPSSCRSSGPRLAAGSSIGTVWGRNRAVGGWVGVAGDPGEAALPVLPKSLSCKWDCLPPSFRLRGRRLFSQSTGAEFVLPSALLVSEHFVASCTSAWGGGALSALGSDRGPLGRCILLAGFSFSLNLSPSRASKLVPQGQGLSVQLLSHLPLGLTLA